MKIVEDKLITFVKNVLAEYSITPAPKRLTNSELFLSVSNDYDVLI